MAFGLTKAQRWNGALPTAVCGSAPIPFMNVGNGAGAATK